MKLLSAFIIAVSFSAFASLFLSCKKDPPTVDPAKQDTLTDGWTMTTFDQQQFTNIRFQGNNGIAVSTLGIFGSSNGGVNWQQRSTYGNGAFGLGYAWQRNIGMDAIGNVVIPQGLVNGGPPHVLAISHDYINFSIIPDSHNYLNDIWFYGNNTGYAITANDQDTAIHFKKTIDGGTTWTTISIIPRMPPITNVGITKMSFVNSQVGWISTPYGVYKTTNGGLNWTFQYAPFGIISEICATDLNTVFIFHLAFVSGGLLPNLDKIVKSTDGGVTWQVVFTNNVYPSIEAIWFVSSSVGYIARGNYIYKTVDGGINWEKAVAINSSVCGFMDIYFSDANHGWACSHRGQILRFQK